MKDNLDKKTTKDIAFQSVKDAKQSYDDYYSTLGNELYDLDDMKKKYEDCLKSYIEHYGDVTEEDDREIYNYYLKIKEKEENNWKIKYLYLQADLENIKKRHNKQLAELRKYEGENILYEIIVFLDYIELKINNETNNDSLNDIKDKTLKLLNMFDVKPIYDKRPVYFNSEYDNAIISLPTQDKSLDNSIVNVIKKGYFFKDKILRYEDVAVNKYTNDK